MHMLTLTVFDSPSKYFNISKQRVRQFCIEHTVHVFLYGVLKLQIYVSTFC